MNAELLFVYGTLRTQSVHAMSRLLASDAEVVAEGYMLGELFEVAGYPGAIESQDDQQRVYGDIYRISASANILAQLDQYEECSAEFPKPHAYLRRKILVYLNSGEHVSAWVYLYLGDCSQLKKIASGDYLQSAGSDQL